ncbi:putative nucleotide-binding alpha-beta plait domain superfamily, RNA-binding domain superfamily [Helianthus anomalus]
MIVTVQDCGKLFFPLGNLGDAFVPKKRDGAGNRFGFIRLKEVDDVDRWLVKLKTMTIDGAILVVNVARFSREGPAIRESLAHSDCGRKEAVSEKREDQFKGVQFLFQRLLVGTELTVPFMGLVVVRLNRRQRWWRILFLLRR